MEPLDQAAFSTLTKKESVMVFEFDHSSVDKGSLPIFKRHYSPRRMKECLFAWQKAIDWNANYFENHDQLRSIERYGEAKKYWKQSGKMLATLLLTLRGTPYIYMPTGTSDWLAFKIGTYPIYWDSILNAAKILLRLILMIELTMVLTSSTKPLDLTYAFEWYLYPLKLIGFPSHEVAMLDELNECEDVQNVYHNVENI